jgi:hypothetical protein
VIYPGKTALISFGVLAIVNFGCSENEGDYFSELQAAEERFETRIDATGDIADEDDQVEEALDAQADFLSDVRELDPPDAVSAAHDDLVRLTEELLKIFQEVDRRGDPNVQQSQFIRTLELGEGLSAACQRIESAAAEQGKSVAMSCADDE